MEKLLKVAVMLTAIDKMSKVVDDATNKSIKSLDNLSKKSDKMAKAAFGFGRDTGAIGLAIGAPIMFATKKAIEFEDKMADVAKVFNMKVGSEEFNTMGDEAKDLSVYLSRSAEDAAALMASLGQGGVEKGELAKVSKWAGEIGVAFDMGADIAGERYTKLKNALGQSFDETKRVTDAINFLSDTQASKASEILDFMAAGGAGVARAAKASGQELAAMGSYLISIGKSGSDASTIMERFYKGIMKNDDTRAIFEKAGSGKDGLLAVLQKGADIKDSTAQFEFFQKFGEYGSDIRLMATNMKDLRASVDSVGDAASYADSVNKEFLNRNSTTQGQLKKQMAEFNRVVLDFGNNGLPILTDLMKTISPIVKSIGEWMRANPELAATIFKVTAATSAVLLVISGLSFGIGGLFKAFSVATQGVSMLGKAFAFVAANPIVLIIAAVAVAALLIYKYWGPISAFFKNVWATIVNSLTAVWNWIKTNWKVVLFGLINPFPLILKAITDLMKNFAPEMYKAGANIIDSIINGITSKANALLDKVKGLAKDIRDFFPFSPAKTGPLKDIHKIKFAETIAMAMKPAPLMKAASGMAKAVAGGMGGGSISGNSGASITFAPVINLSGSATTDDANMITDRLKNEFKRLLDDHMRTKARLAY